MYYITGTDCRGVKFWLNLKHNWTQDISRAARFREAEAVIAFRTVCARNRLLDKSEQTEPDMEKATF